MDKESVRKPGLASLDEVRDSRSEAETAEGHVCDKDSEDARDH